MIVNSRIKRTRLIWIVTCLWLCACAGPLATNPTPSRKESLAIPIRKITATATLKPGISAQTQLVGREPRLWVPPAKNFSAAEGLPLKGEYSLSNADYAKTTQDPKNRLAQYTKEGRIVNFNYTWRAVTCADVKRQGVADFIAQVTLFETTQGAKAAFELYSKEDLVDANLVVQKTKIGDEAYRATGKGKDCDLNFKFGHTVFRRTNVLVWYYLDTYSSKTAARLTQDYQDKLGQYLDSLIQAEARAHPGSPTVLAATRSTIKSRFVEIKPAMAPPVSNGGTDIDRFGPPSEQDCLAFKFTRYEDCTGYGLFVEPSP
jgi:hypothetical protein